MVFEKVCQCIGIGICLLGIIGNSISVYVLSKMNSRSLRLLKYLNLVDTVFLSLLCTLLAMDVLMAEEFYSSLFPLYMCILTSAGIVQTFEAYLTVMIAFVRCLAVAMPFQFSTCMRDSIQNRLLFGIATLSVLFNMSSVVECILSLRRMPSNVWISVLTTHVEPICRQIIPVLAIIICNVILVVSRCRMKSLHGQDNQSSSPDGRHSRSAFQLTCLILAITAMFIATHGSFGVALLYIRISQTVDEIAYYISVFASLMTIINSATNFIFYCLIGSEFRTTLVSLCKVTPCSTRRNRSMPVSTV